MSRLDEVHDLLAETQEELIQDNVSIVTYWFARCNIDRDEYLNFIDQMIKTVVEEENFSDCSNLEKLRILVTHGFVLGLVYGREKQENEF